MPRWILGYLLRNQCRGVKEEGFCHVSVVRSFVLGYSLRKGWAREAFGRYYTWRSNFLCRYLNFILC